MHTPWSTEHSGEGGASLRQRDVPFPSPATVQIEWRSAAGSGKGQSSREQQVVINAALDGAVGKALTMLRSFSNTSYVERFCRVTCSSRFSNFMRVSIGIQLTEDGCGNGGALVEVAGTSLISSSNILCASLLANKRLPPVVRRDWAREDTVVAALLRFLGFTGANAFTSSTCLPLAGSSAGCAAAPSFGVLLTMCTSSDVMLCFLTYLRL